MTDTTNLIDEKPENPEAFPTCGYEGIGGEATYQPGMTLRDYFAAAALPACLTASFAVCQQAAQDDRLEYIGTTVDRAAIWAFRAADAMLKARVR